MVKTHGGSTFRPQVRRSSTPPTSGSTPAAPTIAAPPITTAAAVPPTAPAAAAAPIAIQSSTAVGSSTAAPAPRRYHTRVGPTSPSPPHSRPSQRAPPSKKAWTSGPGESFSSRPHEPQSPPHQGPVRAPPLDLSPASIIWRPLFHCNLILENTDCSERDLHDKIYYDLPSFSTDPEL